MTESEFAQDKTREINRNTHVHGGRAFAWKSLLLFVFRCLAWSNPVHFGVATFFSRSFSTPPPLSPEMLSISTLMHRNILVRVSYLQTNNLSACKREEFEECILASCFYHNTHTHTLILALKCIYHWRGTQWKWVSIHFNGNCGYSFWPISKWEHTLETMVILENLQENVIFLRCILFPIRRQKQLQQQHQQCQKLFTFTELSLYTDEITSELAQAK